ncbi:MAG: DUF177 domain-containing protein [Candidatus Omnitrophica bacterium]|nr:DUF177 domain-containing protein [Candidatus Omnitrophota bacterium]
MKFSVREIPDGGKTLQEVIDCNVIGLVDEGFECLTPLEAIADVEKADQTIIVKMEIKGRYEMTCSRCLEPISQDRVDQFDLYLDIDPKQDIVDLDEDIRQEMLVALSSVVLCKEDCKGLCQDCGVNLNSEQCKCA